jgi:hypothetical protein
MTMHGEIIFPFDFVMLIGQPYSNAQIGIFPTIPTNPPLSDKQFANPGTMGRNLIDIVRTNKKSKS